MNYRHTRAVLLLLSTGLLVTACDPLVVSDDVVVKGIIVNESGQPLEGVAVTVDGVSAEALTDASGRYMVRSPYELEGQLSITAWKPGFTGLEVFMDQTGLETAQTGPGGSARPLMLPPIPAPALLDVVYPLPGAAIGLGPCCDATIEVKGIVSGPPRDNLFMDVVVAIDLSGSIERKAAFADEIAAARALVANLDLRTTRVAFLGFATDATISLPLTDDPSAVAAALDTLEQQGTMAFGEKGGATNFAAAIRAATAELKDQVKTFVSSDTGKKKDVSPRRIMVLLTDGIPTLPSQPGTVQDKADISATLGAARNALAQNVEIHGFAFAIDQAEKSLTTLPAIAAITKGKYRVVDDPSAVALELPVASFVNMGSVSVSNDQTGESLTTIPTPDGYFSAPLKIVPGLQGIDVVAFDESGTLSTMVHVDVFGQSDLQAGEPIGLFGEPVAIAGLRSPLGKDLTGGSLYRVLVGSGREFPDAVASTAGVFSVDGAPSAQVKVTGELVYSDACYKSDIGYVALLPGQDLAAAFASAKNKNVLINTGNFVSCSPYVLQPGQAKFSFDVPAGSVVVFFLVPNSTLAKAQQGQVNALFSEPSANPGGYAQTIAFNSQAGRRGVGGNASIIAFEDMEIVTQHSDQDFDDLVLYIDDMVPTQRACGCE